MEKKPTVFPTSNKSEVDAKKLEQFEKEKIEVTNQIFDNARPEDTPEGHVDAIETMRLRTETQLKLRDAALKNNAEQTAKYHEQSERIMAYTGVPAQAKEAVEALQQESQPATSKPKFNTDINKYMSENKYNQPKPTTEKLIEKEATAIKTNDSYVDSLSQPDFNTAFDILPIPSAGLTYKDKKPSVRVAYMTAADEDILTSPNLLASGKFLEILINRKLLEQGLRYKDLLVGDRNAIMLWLRATSYGHMYPIMLLDEFDNPFETEINLNDLKTKQLGATPDAEGLFYIKLALTGTEIKFKLLNVGDVDAIQAMVDADTANEIPLNKTNTYKLKKHIVEINGNRDKQFINDQVNSMRIGDSGELRKYIDGIESGIELEIEVSTPGGGTVKTFLPLNVNFFWPNIGL